MLSRYTNEEQNTILSYFEGVAQGVVSPRGYWLAGNLSQTLEEGAKQCINK